MLPGARALQGAAHHRARINNPRNAWLFDGKFHVDVALNQADVLASLIEEEMSLGDMMTLLKLRRGQLLAGRGEDAGAAPAPWAWRSRTCRCPRSSVIAPSSAAGEVVIPRGNVRFEVGDEVLALVDAASAPELAALFGPPRAAGAG